MNYHKGVNVIEGESPSPIAGVATNISAILGNFERGPINKATLVGSLAQFQSIFGTKAPAGTTSYNSVEAFFKNAGYAPLYVVRIASDTAAAASLTIQDRNGTPANTLTIEGRTPGSWATGLQVEIKDDNFLTTVPAALISAAAQSATLKSVTNLQIGSLVQFDNGTNQEIKMLTGVNVDARTIAWSGGLTYAYPAATSTVKSLEFEIVVYKDGFQVENWPNLSMVDTVDHFCETVVNDSIKGSRYIKVTDLKSADTDDKDRPLVTAKTSLTGGDDGLEDVEASDYQGLQASKTGLYALDEIDNLFRFCIPNPALTDSDPAAAYVSLVQSGIDYAELRKTISFYADIPAAKTPAEAAGFAGSYESRQASFWYPWITAGGSDLPPSSFVMGAAVAKDAGEGVHVSIGNHTLRGADALEYDLSTPEDEIVNDANINTIRAFSGSGIKTWGGRSKSAVLLWRFLNDSELWNYIARSIMLGTEDVVFKPILPATMGTVKRKLDGLGSALVRTGAVGWYTAVCNADINPEAETAQGILHASFEYLKPGAVEKFVVTLTSSSSAGTEVA